MQYKQQTSTKTPLKGSLVVRYKFQTESTHKWQQFTRCAQKQQRVNDQH